MMLKEEKRLSNREWYDAVYQEHHELVFRVIMQTTKDRTLSEDLMQEVFETLWEKANEIRSHKNPAGWLVVTARRKTANELKKAYRHHETELFEAAFLRRAPEEKLAFQEWLPEQLTPDEKKVLTLRLYEKWSFEDIGREFRSSGPAAQMRYGRALDHLRNLLGVIQ